MKKQSVALLLVLAILFTCGAAGADFPSGSVLPSRYDMREDGIVTPVKLQYPWGACWSFGTVAAAETSILSAMGKTFDEYPLDLSELHAAWFVKHPLTEADDPMQAGEGPVLSPGMDPQMEEQQKLNSGSPYMVTALFATGAGPVEESTAPYHGKEKTPEAWVALHEPEKWIENYMRMNMEKTILDEETAAFYEMLPPEMRPDPPISEDELRAEAEQALNKKQAEEADNGMIYDNFSIKAFFRNRQ